MANDSEKVKGSIIAGIEFSQLLNQKDKTEVKNSKEVEIVAGDYIIEAYDDTEKDFENRKNQLENNQTLKKVLEDSKATNFEEYKRAVNEKYAKKEREKRRNKETGLDKAE